MCDQQRLRPACAYAVAVAGILYDCEATDRTSFGVFKLKRRGGCIGSYESTLVKMPHCWKPHVAVHIYFSPRWSRLSSVLRWSICCRLFIVDCCSHSVVILSCLEKRSGSVVECLTRDRKAAGSSLTGVTALWSLSKTHLS